MPYTSGSWARGLKALYSQSNKEKSCKLQARSKQFSQPKCKLLARSPLDCGTGSWLHCNTARSQLLHWVHEQMPWAIRRSGSGREHSQLGPTLFCHCFRYYKVCRVRWYRLFCVRDRKMLAESVRRLRLRPHISDPWAVNHNVHKKVFPMIWGSCLVFHRVSFSMPYLTFSYLFLAVHFTDMRQEPTVICV